MLRQQVLGDALHVTLLKLAGTLAPGDMALALRELVELVGMSAAGLAPMIWSYPLPDGAGGLGNTICQPLVESFVISDDWPDLGHTYLVLASCRPYSVKAVKEFLAGRIGKILRWKLVKL
jgi:hypothetical protein